VSSKVHQNLQDDYEGVYAEIFYLNGGDNLIQPPVLVNSIATITLMEQNRT